MASIPPISRFTTEDFKEQASWIGKLISRLNSFMESTVSALSGNLTITDNFLGEMREVEITGSYPLKIALKKRFTPSAVLVGNVVRSDRASFSLTDAPYVKWSITPAGQLQIDDVLGVSASASAKYKLTLVIM